MKRQKADGRVGLRRGTSIQRHIVELRKKLVLLARCMCTYQSPKHVQMCRCVQTHMCMYAHTYIRNKSDPNRTTNTTMNIQ